MTISQRTRVAFVVAGLSGTLVTTYAQDLEGSKDHPLISRYPGARITEYVQKEYDEFQLPLGALRDGKPEKSQPLEGKITHILYENPAGRSVLEIYRNYENALRGSGFQVLFSCASVEQCGGGYFAGLPGANAWWNDGNPVRHLSARLSRPQGDVYVSLHVQDGQYGTWLDIVETKPMEAGRVTVNAASLAADLARTGHVAVYGIYFDSGQAEIKAESEAALASISQLLGQDPKLGLYVVGHTDNQGGLDMNMDLSRRRAEAVAAALTTKYKIAADRLRAFGVGPYAPVASNKTEDGRSKNRRVELVEK